MAIKLKSGFEVLRYSDLDYEQMTADIQYDGEQVAQINMDGGIDNLEIEIFIQFSKPDFKMKFKLSEFLEALEEARKVLEEYK